MMYQGFSSDRREITEILHEAQSLRAEEFARLARRSVAALVRAARTLRARWAYELGLDPRHGGHA